MPKEETVKQACVLMGMGDGRCSGVGWGGHKAGFCRVPRVLQAEREVGHGSLRTRSSAGALGNRKQLIDMAEEQARRAAAEGEASGLWAEATGQPG